MEALANLGHGQIFSMDWSLDGQRLFLARGHTESDAVLIRDLS